MNRAASISLAILLGLASSADAPSPSPTKLETRGNFFDVQLVNWCAEREYSKKEQCRTSCESTGSEAYDFDSICGFASSCKCQ